MIGLILPGCYFVKPLSRFLKSTLKQILRFCMVRMLFFLQKIFEGQIVRFCNHKGLEITKVITGRAKKDKLLKQNCYPFNRDNREN